VFQNGAKFCWFKHLEAEKNALSGLFFNHQNHPGGGVREDPADVPLRTTLVQKLKYINFGELLEHPGAS
jgi:hypothetical protein